MAVLAQYTATGSTLNPTTTASGTSATALAKHASLSYFTVDVSSYGFASQPIIAASQNGGYTTQALAVTNNQYFSFTVTADTGKTLNLASLAFDVTRGGASTPRGVLIRSSADEYVADLYNQEIATLATTWTPVTIDLSGAAYRSLAAITFRVWVWMPNNVDMCFDNITLNGDMANLLISNQYTDGTLNPTTLAAGVTNTMTDGAGLSNFYADSIDGWGSVPVLGVSPNNGITSLALAISNNAYFDYTATADAGKKLNLASLTYKVGRGGSSTPRGMSLRSSADGFTADLFNQAIATATPTWTPVAIDLTGAQYQGVSTITFRFWVYTPDSGRYLDFDDIALTGAVVNIAAGRSQAIIIQ